MLKGQDGAILCINCVRGFMIFLVLRVFFLPDGHRIQSVRLPAHFQTESFVIPELYKLQATEGVVHPINPVNHKASALS